MSDTLEAAAACVRIDDRGESQPWPAETTVAFARALVAAAAERDELKVHVRYLLGYIGIDWDEDLEALGAPPGIVAARAALPGSGDE